MIAMLDCCIHLSSWLHPEVQDGDLAMLFPFVVGAGIIDLMGHEPNEVLSETSIEVRFDYPLDKPVVFTCNGPVTLKTFIDFVAHSYERIYREEKESATIEEGRSAPGLLNRNRTDGKYKIWGHVLDDLFLEGAECGEDDVWDLYIGS